MSRPEAEKPAPPSVTDDDRARLRAMMAGWTNGWASRPPEGAVDALLRYGELLLVWNQRINLTAARSVAALIDEQFVDDFPLARRLEGPARVVDIGSGGGLPAIPLALLRPLLRVTLCEPIAKKQAFLRTASRELGLGDRLQVRGDRAQALAETRPNFDAAVSRATFPPAEWLTLGPRLVRPGGRVFGLIAARAVPASIPAEVYLGGSRALVELTVAQERST
jgi:16S rRNA (guanine527-N7)-methyltransferase